MTPAERKLLVMMARSIAEREPYSMRKTAIFKAAFEVEQETFEKQLEHTLDATGEVVDAEV